MNAMCWWRRRFSPLLLVLVALLVVTLLNGAKPKKAKSTKKAKAKTARVKDPKVPKDPPRTHANFIPEGRPWYQQMMSDGILRIAVFYGWDHPREVIEDVFPAFETLNGKILYFKGQRARIEIGLTTQVSDTPKAAFKAALEDASTDIVIYSGHARYGGGPAFADRDDIFRCGNGDKIEDRQTLPYRYFQATAEDLEATILPQNYRIFMLNSCDSEAHFRTPWSKRFADCGAPIDLITVEYPVFNLYDNVRVLNLVRDLLQFADWKTIKAHYDAEVHKRKNGLVVDPVYMPSDSEDLAAVSLDYSSAIPDHTEVR